VKFALIYSSKYYVCIVSNITTAFSSVYIKFVTLGKSNISYWIYYELMVYFVRVMMVMSTTAVISLIVSTVSPVIASVSSAVVFTTVSSVTCHSQARIQYVNLKF
jgi:hypothetical protein